MDESPSPMPGELDLNEMCRRAAAKHSLDWPSKARSKKARAQRWIYMTGRGCSRVLPRSSRGFQPSQHASQRCDISGTNPSYIGCQLKVSPGWTCGMSNQVIASVASHLHPPIAVQPYPPPLLHCRDRQRGCLPLFLKNVLLPCPGCESLECHLTVHRISS